MLNSCIKYIRKLFQGSCIKNDLEERSVTIAKLKELSDQDLKILLDQIIIEKKQVDFKTDIIENIVIEILNRNQDIPKILNASYRLKVKDLNYKLIQIGRHYVGTILNLSNLAITDNLAISIEFRHYYKTGLFTKWYIYNFTIYPIENHPKRLDKSCYYLFHTMEHKIHLDTFSTHAERYYKENTNY